MLDLMGRELGFGRSLRARPGEPRRRPARHADRQRRQGRARGARHDAIRSDHGYELKLPDLGEGLTEGEIARWLVSEGQEVAEDDPLVEIQTDKTTVEIPSPAAGNVTRILVEEGKVVPVGTVLVVIGGEDGAAGAAPPAGASAPKEDGRRRSCGRSPRSWGSTSTLAGTGPQGRITEEDVRAAAARAKDVANRCAESAG